LRQRITIRHSLIRHSQIVKDHPLLAFSLSPSASILSWIHSLSRFSETILDDYRFSETPNAGGDKAGT
jgi:hypothetical protein